MTAAILTAIGLIAGFSAGRMFDLFGCSRRCRQISEHLSAELESLDKMYDRLETERRERDALEVKLAELIREDEESDDDYPVLDERHEYFAEQRRAIADA